MEYISGHEEITNAIARELTGIKSENSMKNVFYRLRDRGLIEQVPGKRGFKAAWKKK
jgi:ATP-dependent DNA helicase RecG